MAYSPKRLMIKEVVVGCLASRVHWPCAVYEPWPGRAAVGVARRYGAVDVPKPTMVRVITRDGERGEGRRRCMCQCGLWLFWQNVLAISLRLEHTLGGSAAGECVAAAVEKKCTKRLFSCEAARSPRSSVKSVCAQEARAE